jgi:hypothetical protein
MFTNQCLLDCDSFSFCDLANKRGDRFFAAEPLMQLQCYKGPITTDVSFAKDISAWTTSDVGPQQQTDARPVRLPSSSVFLSQQTSEQCFQHNKPAKRTGWPFIWRPPTRSNNSLFLGFFPELRVSTLTLWC